ncbi:MULTISPECIES: SGNH/GDSL hydrolase family protein [Sphingomonas]|uniref:SGNH/GDSL hydrolase family protein n=1 Tax=Sphingomonas kyungheensis TaxID=1069987 RepID=A0ABU8H3L8_9SPHN|nr:SGNH/GDSL hydrolase family protein [Sphingomonas sp. RIT328]EZP51109.1 GDSL-like Lipase/Acylhydrolase family protein [Sphingomonas sp. RIT328]
MRYALLAALLIAGPAAAQTNVPGDPYAGDPVGIVADPCPVHPKPEGAGWQMWNLHMLTRDHGQLCRYRAQNAALTEPVRVVFMGDSITDNWIGADPSLFTKGLVDRGISGQTTPQMLLRFRQDVLALHPKAVHIMAGTNDIAGNTGAATMETVQGNIETMAELAHAHGIKVILASVPPAAAFPWSPDKRPVPQIAALNGWLRGYAKAHGYTYVDYHAALADAAGGMKPGLASDGVHPTPAGYAVMRPLALAAIAKTLGQR